MLWDLSGTISDSGFGSAIGLAGDVDGDGQIDLLIADSRGNEVHLFAGIPKGFANTSQQLNGPVNDRFGSSLAAVDFDDDRYDDAVDGLARSDPESSLGSTNRGQSCKMERRSGWNLS